MVSWTWNKSFVTLPLLLWIFTSFPTSLGLHFIHPEKQTSRAPIGWDLLPCVLWLAENLVHAWGMQEEHVCIPYRKSVFFIVLLLDLGSQKRDFLLNAAEATFTFGIPVWFLSKAGHYVLNWFCYTSVSIELHLLPLFLCILMVKLILLWESKYQQHMVINLVWEQLAGSCLRTWGTGC